MRMNLKAKQVLRLIVIEAQASPPIRSPHYRLSNQTIEPKHQGVISRFCILKSPKSILSTQLQILLITKLQVIFYFVYKKLFFVCNQLNMSFAIYLLESSFDIPKYYYAWRNLT